jgi:hypothetical protein
MISLLGIVVSILVAFGGLVIWAKSDMPIIQREIAINTRKDMDDGPKYSAVRFLSFLLKCESIIIWFVCFIIILVSLKYGKEYEKIISRILIK